MYIEFTTQFIVLSAHSMLPSIDFNYINTKKSQFMHRLYVVVNDSNNKDLFHI